MAADEYQLRKDIDRIKTLADKLEELTDSKYDAEDFNIFDIIAAHQELMNRVEEIETHEGIIVDDEISSTSARPVQNRVISAALQTKINKITDNVDLLLADGTTISQSSYALSDDPRLSNPRTPLPHEQSATTIKDNNVNKYNNIGTLTQNDQQTINQAIDAKIGNKVDKETGKILSTNDFTNTYKNRLDNLPDNIPAAVNTISSFDDDTTHCPTVRAVYNYVGGINTKILADGATVTEPDKYISGLYENFPHAFSDLFNYFKRYYTNSQGDEVGEQDQYDSEGHHAASVQWYIERIADKLYGHDENLAVLNSHSHGVWELVNVNFGALYVNEAIRMCELRFVRPSNNYSANNVVTVPVTISGDVTVNPIAESYPPVDAVRVPGYRPEVVLSLGTNGSVSIRSSVDLSSVVISGMFRWHY